MNVFRLELRARYVGGIMSLHTTTGDQMTTVPLDRFNQVDALDLMELGFGDLGQVECLSLDALDTALVREGHVRLTDWIEDEDGASWLTVERS